MSLISEIDAGARQTRSTVGGTALCLSPEGELLVPGTPAFYDRIGYRNPDFDLGDYAVRNMGFLAIARTAPDRLKLRFRPELTAGRTIEAVCGFLAQRQLAEVEIEYLDDVWRTEVWPNDPALLHRIVELCAKPAAAPESASPFHAEPLALAGAAEDYGHPLKPLFQKWRASFAQFNDTTLPFLMRFGFFSKLVIISARKAGEPLCFQFIGGGLQVYDEKTMCALIGNPVTEQPDKAYGIWVGAQYKAFLESGAPRLDQVQATVRQRSGAVRNTCYERLLLPWHSESGAQIITCASVLIAAENSQAANENAPETAAAASGGPGLGTLRHKPFDLG